MIKLIFLFFLSLPLWAQRPGQLILVTTENSSDVRGMLRRFVRVPDQRWQRVGSALEVVLGKKGLAPLNEKMEGDGRSPTGQFPLGMIFGYEAPEKAFKSPFLKLTESTVCVDDPDSSVYNELVDQNIIKKDWKSAEQMRRGDHQYRWGAMVLYNSAPTEPKKGSCIFLHIWKSSSSGTAGCTAMKEADLLEILSWLDPKLHPTLVQLSRADYMKYKVSWDLPDLSMGLLEKTIQETRKSLSTKKKP